MPVRSGPIFPPTILSFRFSVGFDFQSSLLRDRRYHSPLCGQTFSMSSIPQSSSDATRHSANTFALCFNGLCTPFGSSMVFAPPSVPPLSGDRNVIGGQKRCSFGLSEASPFLIVHYFQIYFQSDYNLGRKIFTKNLDLKCRTN